MLSFEMTFHKPKTNIIIVLTNRLIEVVKRKTQRRETPKSVTSDQLPTFQLYSQAGMTQISVLFGFCPAEQSSCLLFEQNIMRMRTPLPQLAEQALQAVVRHSGHSPRGAVQSVLLLGFSAASHLPSSTLSFEY